jgi:beta-galactosidase
MDHISRIRIFGVLSGIDRNVYLYSTASERVADFFAKPDLDAAYKNGSLTVDVDVKNYHTSAKALMVEAQLLDAAGARVYVQSSRVNVAAGARQTVVLSQKVSAT